MSIWGKVVGGFAGLAMGGPLGAVLGAVAGHAYDTMKSEKLELVGSSEERQIAFTTAVIVLSAKMAKADGHVTREEVKAFKEAFNIPPGEMTGVGRIFDEAKSNAEGYEPYAQQIATMFANERPILEELLGALFHIAKADGKIHQKEVEFCQDVSKLFGLTREEFERLRQLETPQELQELQDLEVLEGGPPPPLPPSLAVCVGYPRLGGWTWPAEPVRAR